MKTLSFFDCAEAPRGNEMRTEAMSRNSDFMDGLAIRWIGRRQSAACSGLNDIFYILIVGCAKSAELSGLDGFVQE